MKKFSIISFVFFLCTIVSAQQKAVTENGDEVLLYQDGSWKYVNENLIEDAEIQMNLNEFEKSEKSSFLLRSNVLNVGFWLNPKEWSFKKAQDNEGAEYELQLKDGDLYGMIISEQVEIPLESLRTIAVDNAKTAAPDTKIVKEEYRTVNGKKVLMMQMDGTMQGIKFSYLGYYYSNSNGTVQFITYTSQNLLKRYRSKCENLLNGFVEIDD